jgi:heme-degrading monooxygenase HmoA
VSRPIESDGSGGTLTKEAVVSVLMVLKVPADAETFQRVAAENKDAMAGIAERARGRGAIHHAFCVGDDGQVVIVDEWDAPESFEAFFEAEAPNIGPLMAQAGAEGPPGAPTFYRKLDTADEF